MSQTHAEIMATPESLEKTAACIEANAGKLKKIVFGWGRRLIFVGCGSSYCLAKSAARMASLRLGVEAAAVAAGDALLHTASYRALFEGALVVTLSRSGSTSEIVYALQEMRKNASFKVLSINCVEGSPLSKMGDFALDMPWAFDSSVCQTRTVTCLFYACAQMVACAAADAALRDSLADAAARLPKFIADNEARCREIAAMPWTDAVVLGDAEISGLCEEAALAYKEICQLPGVHYNLLDSRHGPMVMFKKTTLVIAVLSDCGRYEVDFMKDAAAKGGVVVTVSDAPLAMDGTINIATGLAGCHIARGIPFIVVNQLLSLCKSAFTGANPDKPEGLKPWIKI